MFGISETFEKAVSRSKSGKGHLWPTDQWSKTFVVALACFAEENGLDGAAGTQGLLDEANAFNADESVVRGQTSAQGYAELLEPAIIAAGEERGVICRTSAARSFARGSHHRGA